MCKFLHLFPLASYFSLAPDPQPTNTMLLTPLLRRAPPPESGTLQIMVNQEASRYQSRDYFHTHGIVPGQVNVEVNVEVRQKLIEWMVHVHDYAKYTVDTLEIAISILDRYLLTAVGADALKDRDEYQLAAVVAFYCASKSHEKIPFFSHQFSRNISRLLYSR